MEAMIEDCSSRPSTAACRSGTQRPHGCSGIDVRTTALSEQGVIGRLPRGDGYAHAQRQAELLQQHQQRYSVLWRCSLQRAARAGSACALLPRDGGGGSERAALRSGHRALPPRARGAAAASERRRVQATALCRPELGGAASERRRAQATALCRPVLGGGQRASGVAFRPPRSAAPCWGRGQRASGVAPRPPRSAAPCWGA